MKAADCWGQAMESPGTGAGGRHGGGYSLKR